jgi:Protein of unknown function (DUF3309)
VLVLGAAAFGCRTRVLAQPAPPRHDAGAITDQRSAADRKAEGGSLMSTRTILIVILILLLIGALPTWPYSSGWGYYPSGGLGLILIILLILVLAGRL